MVDAGARHRLLAILAADAVGYSRLMASDETAALTALDAAREVFRSQTTFNQSRIVDTAGDSVLAVFETATGAVTAALAIQAEINASAGTFPDDRQMRFRIGVHLGDVIEKTDGTVYGDGVNIAARLQGLAEPGGVTVSESIQVAVRGRIAATFVDIGQQVKSIAQPISSYRIAIGASPAGVDRARHRNALYDKPSVAVLPFTNMGGAPDQEYFSDGLTEDIITALVHCLGPRWRHFVTPCSKPDQWGVAIGDDDAGAS